MDFKSLVSIGCINLLIALVFLLFTLIAPCETMFPLYVASFSRFCSRLARNPSFLNFMTTLSGFEFVLFNRSRSTRGIV